MFQEDGILGSSNEEAPCHVPDPHTGEEDAMNTTIQKKTKRHCNFYGKDNHDESKHFKKMAALEAAIKKQHIILDSSSESTSHGHTLYAFVFSYNASSSSSYNEWLIYFGASYHIIKDKVNFML